MMAPGKDAGVDSSVFPHKQNDDVGIEIVIHLMSHQKPLQLLVSCDRIDAALAAKAPAPDASFVTCAWIVENSIRDDGVRNMHRGTGGTCAISHPNGNRKAREAS